MFRMAKSSFTRGAYGAPTPQAGPDAIKGAAVESMVRQLPELHREVLRGFYVYGAHPMRLARFLCIRPADLPQLLRNARTMAKNRLA